MQVSTRLTYSEPGFSRSRQPFTRPWTGAPVPAVKADERGGGYRGTLARGSHQQVNDRVAGGSADKEVFVARALSSTLAMLQMSGLPENTGPVEPSPPPPAGRESVDTSFLDDLFSGLFEARQAQ